LVVFRPFKGEVIAARIADQSPEGINRQFSASTLQSSLELTSLSTVVTDFFDDIFVPWTELPEGSELYATLSISSIIEQSRLTIHSEPSENLWVWKEEDQVMYFDNNEMVRFRVIAEEWHDQTPSKPVEAVEGTEEAPAPINTKPPYKITGSMSGPGLGCCLWWE
jgi:DNA-directed RNA polymerase III subunit RPC8